MHAMNSKTNPDRSTQSAMPQSRYALVGKSDAMSRLGQTIDLIAARSCTVLIHGPSGSGKELVARNIHMQSHRSDSVMVPVDCTTLSDTLFESQLFGHVRGAFTGAERDTLGFIRSADTGTVFLDEIGELPLPAQSKLLRVMQEQQVVPVGGTEAIPVDVRFVAATHRNLEEMVERGDFRADLFFRLNVVQLNVPALSERHDDLQVLIDYRLRRLATAYGEELRHFDNEAIVRLLSYDWPGNVRQLNNAIEHAFVMSTSVEIPAAALPDYVQGTASRASTERIFDMGVLPLDDAQRQLVVNALRATGGNQGRAAELLQIERRRMYRFVQKYKIDVKKVAEV